jgi:hypothetical protein
MSRKISRGGRPRTDDDAFELAYLSVSSSCETFSYLARQDLKFMNLQKNQARGVPFLATNSCCVQAAFSKVGTKKHNAILSLLYAGFIYVIVVFMTNY